MISETSMQFVRIVALAVTALLAAGAARAAAGAPEARDCPCIGAMPDYEAGTKVHWWNWDSYAFRITRDDKVQQISPQGVICYQQYSEEKGKTDGSALEIMLNYKAAWQQLGAGRGIRFSRKDPMNRGAGRQHRDGRGRHWTATLAVVAGRGMRFSRKDAMIRGAGRRGRDGRGPDRVARVAVAARRGMRFSRNDLMQCLPPGYDSVVGRSETRAPHPHPGRCAPASVRCAAQARGAARAG
jgi:hypothetical protein